MKLKLKEFIDLIKKGKSFNELAKDKFNLNESDTNLGYLKKSDLPAESANIIFNARLDETSPIKTKFDSVYIKSLLHLKNKLIMKI